MATMTSMPLITLKEMYESSFGRPISSRRSTQDEFSIFKRTVNQMHSYHKRDLSVKALDALPQIRNIIDGLRTVTSNNTRVMEQTVARLKSIIQSSSISVVSDRSDNTQAIVDTVLKKLSVMPVVAKGKDRALTKTVASPDLNSKILGIILSLGRNSPKEIIMQLLGRKSQE